MNRIHALLVSTAILTAGPAFAQYIDEWDANDDGVLSEEEWGTGFTEAGLFSEWDEDESGTIGDDEFATGLFGWFDDDDDGELTAEEWDEGFDNWYGEQAVNLDFSNWDDNEDGYVDEEEFTDAFTDAGLFGDFASESGLVGEEETEAFSAAEYEVGEDEFLGGLFNWFDEDEDAALGEEEAGWFE